MSVQDQLLEIERLVGQAVERCETLREENARLKIKLGELLEELERLKRENQDNRSEIESLNRERMEIGDRVARIRENISILEQPLIGTP